MNRLVSIDALFVRIPEISVLPYRLCFIEEVCNLYVKVALARFTAFTL